DLVAPQGAPIDALHLGAGAVSLARDLAHTRPGSRQRAVDPDAALAETVRRRLPSGRRAGLRVGGGAAREWVAVGHNSRADLGISDVFTGACTPAHVTSVEFYAEAARVVRPDGFVVVNIGDGYALRHTRAQVATVRSILPHVVMTAEPGILRGR